MKKMVYIIIAVTALFVIGSVALGCSTNPTKKIKADISGVSLSQNHMNYSGCYSFFLRKEDGKVLFNADVRLEKDNSDFESIVLENCEVESKYYDKLLELVNQNEIREYTESYKKKTELFQVSDETTNTTTLYFADGSDKSADSGDYREELQKFFTDLALSYKYLSVSINQ